MRDTEVFSAPLRGTIWEHSLLLPGNATSHPFQTAETSSCVQKEEHALCSYYAILCEGSSEVTFNSHCLNSKALQVVAT